MNGLFKDEPVKLIVNRRTIAAGLAALVAAPLGAREALARLSNTPLSFSADDFAMEMRDGLFLPDYRYPMVRVVFENGDTTRWHKYKNSYYRLNDKGRAEHVSVGADRPGNRAVAIECCAPDKNGAPRYSQLSIG